MCFPSCKLSKSGMNTIERIDCRHLSKILFSRSYCSVTSSESVSRDYKVWREYDIQFVGRRCNCGWKTTSSVWLKKCSVTIGSIIHINVIPTIFNLQKHFFKIQDQMHSVWKSPKMSHFPPIFVLLKLTCLVTLFDCKLQVFKNSPKWTIFGIFNLCKRNSLRSQCWMRLFLWFSNTVPRRSILNITVG